MSAVLHPQGNNNNNNNNNNPNVTWVYFLQSIAVSGYPLFLTCYKGGGARCAGLRSMLDASLRLSSLGIEYCVHGS